MAFPPFLIWPFTQAPVYASNRGIQAHVPHSGVSRTRLDSTPYFVSLFAMPASVEWRQSALLHAAVPLKRSPRSSSLRTSSASAARSALPGFMRHLSSPSPLFPNARGLSSALVYVRSLSSCGGMCW